MDPLDPRLRVVERRQELAVAERPVGAAEAGVRGTHDDADRDEDQRRDEGRRGELLETGQASSWTARAGTAVDRDGCGAILARSLGCAGDPNLPCRGDRRADPASGRLQRRLRHPPSSAPASAAPSGSAEALCERAPDPTSLPDAWDTASQSPSVIPFIVTNRIVCGQARIVFLFLDDAQRVVSSPDRTATVAFYDLATDPETPVTTAESEFVWAIPDERGMYVVNADLPHAGIWGAEITTEAPQVPTEKIRMTFEVADSTPTVQVGDPAPPSDTPTAADVDGDLSRISTDADPVPAFYETSVADALAAQGAVRARLRHAEVLHEPAVRPDPRFDQADRRGASRRDVHQRRAVRPGVHRRPAAAGARRERAAAGRPGDRRVGPPVGAVDLRGRRRRDRPGSFEGVVGEAELERALAEVEG